MADARESLRQTLVVLSDCLSDNALIDKAPAEVTHNARARMLRQGLAVLVFATVETFIRDRTVEALRSFTNPNLAFTDLSVPLQKATTLGALEGVRFRLKFEAPTNRVAWLVANLTPIVGATSNVQQLSEYSFGYAASNIDEEDVAEILKSFGVEAPWSQVTSLTSRCRVAILDAQADFVAMRKRRHASAHALAGQVLFSELESSLRSSLGICLAFDLLLSHAAALINKRSSPGLGGRKLLKQSDVKLVFIEPRNRTNTFAVVKEYVSGQGSGRRRSLRVFATQSDAIAHGERYATRNEHQLIVLDTTSIPSHWVTW